MYTCGGYEIFCSIRPAVLVAMFRVQELEWSRKFRLKLNILNYSVYRETTCLPNLVCIHESKTYWHMVFFIVTSGPLSLSKCNKHLSFFSYKKSHRYLLEADTTSADTFVSKFLTPTCMQIETHIRMIKRKKLQKHKFFMHKFIC